MGKDISQHCITLSGYIVTANLYGKNHLFTEFFGKNHLFTDYLISIQFRGSNLKLTYKCDV